ncbi:MAG TPA: hypothetical protein VKA15_14730 [Isosphaeraceae bacterium]|nr:hypothetical protein [Isosphaeraceae bacterium]
MGWTAWAVASVSVWWVPAYLALMVLIFITPRGQRPWASATEASVESVGAGSADLGWGLRVDRADGVDQHHPDAEPDSRPAANELTELSGSSPDSARSSTAMPRRGRVRARKAARTAAEPMPDSPPVTWIQVGPGKFVRVEGSIPAVDQTLTEAVTVGASPVADALVHAPPTSTAPAAAQAAQDPPDPLAMIPGDVGMVVGPDDCVLGSVTEEYGIAPSAFSPAPLATSSVEGLAHDVSGVVASPEANPGSVVNLGRKMPRCGVDSGRFWSYRRASRGQADWDSFGIANAMRGLDRASSRRNVQPGPKPRTLVWFVLNERQQQAARRAFGRISHVERALRPRSPPQCQEMGIHVGNRRVRLQKWETGNGPRRESVSHFRLGRWVSRFA